MVGAGIYLFPFRGGHRDSRQIEYYSEPRTPLSRFTYSKSYNTLFFRVPHSLLCNDYFYLRPDTFQEVFRGLRWFLAQCLASLSLATCIMAEPDTLSHALRHQFHPFFR